MKLHLCLVLTVFSLSSLAQPSRFEFPVRPPVADADPTVRYPISVPVPTRLKVERTADTISVSLDTNSFESTNLTVGTNMVTGTLGDLYVYPVGAPRPTNSAALGLEHLKKYCSHSGSKKDEAVFLGFGFVSAQLQGFLNLLLRRSLAKTPKILAPNGYRIFLNALGSRGAIATGLDFNLGTIYLHTVPDGMPQPGIRYEVEMDVAAFETDIPGQHFWLPMARGKKFQVLWRQTLKQVVK